MHLAIPKSPCYPPGPLRKRPVTHSSPNFMSASKLLDRQVEGERACASEGRVI